LQKVAVKEFQYLLPTLQAYTCLLGFCEAEVSGRSDSILSEQNTVGQFEVLVGERGLGKRCKGND